MSINDFFANLETGKERNSLFLALSRLQKLGSLKDLVLAATVTDTGWISWQDMASEAVDGAAIARA